MTPERMRQAHRIWWNARNHSMTARMLCRYYQRHLRSPPNTSFSGPKGPPESPLVGMKVKMLWITCSEYPNNPKNACTAGRYKVGDQWVYTQAQIERGKWHLWAEDGIQPSDALDDPQWLMQYA